jgi:hypothetical protein
MCNPFFFEAYKREEFLFYCMHVLYDTKTDHLLKNLLNNKRSRTRKSQIQTFFPDVFDFLNMKYKPMITKGMLNH